MQKGKKSKGEVICANCVYFCWIEFKEKAVLDYGECRRFPRVPISTEADDVALSSYPIQTRDDWCGEFQEVPEGGLN